MSLSEIVTEFHKLFASTKKPEYRAIAANLTNVSDPVAEFDAIWQRRVNAGCERAGLPLIYPEAPQEP